MNHRRPVIGFMLWVFFLTLFGFGNTPARSASFQLPEVKKVKLSNGLQLHFLPYQELPLIEIYLLIPTGSTLDPEGKEGLANLTAELLTKGTKTRSANDISEAIDFIGGSIDVDVTYDYTTVSVEVLSKDLDIALTLLSDILINAVFAQEEIERSCRQIQAAIEQMKEEPEEIIQLHYANLLFSPHPYARPLLGQSDGICKISQADILQFYQSFRPQDAILSIVGDVEFKTLQKKLEETLSAWGKTSSSPTKRPEALKPPEIKGKKILLVNKSDATQTQIRIGNIGVKRNFPDYFPLTVANTILGGSFTARLTNEIRVKRSLSYSAWSSFQLRKEPGAFILGTFTKNETTLETIQVALEELRKLRDSGVTEEELKRAKSFLKGQFPLRIEAPEARAQQTASIAFYGLPENFLLTYQDNIEKVTLAEVNQTIKTYFPVDDLAIVVLSNAEAVQKDLEKLGTVTVKDYLDLK